MNTCTKKYSIGFTDHLVKVNRYVLYSVCTILVFLFLNNHGIAQPNLVLSKPGKAHHFFYQVGDKIMFKEKNSKEKKFGVIISLNDSVIELARGPKVKIYNIATIYRTRSFFAQAAGAGIVILGVYIPISVLNRAIHDEHPLINDDLILVNGSMLGVSGISLLLVHRKLHIGAPWKLQVLDFGRPVYD